jgi:uncharacterized protein YneF (UPF0154 family)
MSEMDYLTVLCLVAGTIIGVCLLSNYLALRYLQKMQELYAIEEKPPIISVTIERVDNMLYCYDEDDKFICQGADLNEIEQSYKDRYPDKSCVMMLRGEAAIIDELTAGHTNNQLVNK